MGNDFLGGGQGNDLIQGGTGADFMYGGDGADTFVFQTGDSLYNNVNAGDFDDFVMDYNDAADYFDLAGTAANSFADVLVTNFTHAIYGVGAHISLMGSDDYIWVAGYSKAQSSASDFIF